MQGHELCEKFILNQWDGKQRTVKLPDNCGTISLTPGTDESVFYTISFNALKNFREPPPRFSFPSLTFSVVAERKDRGVCSGNVEHTLAERNAAV